MRIRATMLWVAVLAAILPLGVPALVSAAALPGTSVTVSSIRNFVEDVVQTLLTLAVVVTVGYMVWGGFKMATASETKAFTQGKQILINAIWGAAAVLAVGLIVSTIARIAQDPGSALN